MPLLIPLGPRPLYEQVHRAPPWRPIAMPRAGPPGKFAQIIGRVNVLVFGSRPLITASEQLRKLKSSPMIFQNSNRRQTLANQGCRSRGTPAGR